MEINNLDAFGDALDGRGAHKDCPSCGVDDWAFASTPMLLQSVGDEEGLVVGKGYPVLARVCDNCGFMSLHFVPVLEQEGPTPAENPGNAEPSD